MEKRKPHYPLGEIQAQVAIRGADAFTRTALQGAWDLGLDTGQAIAAVLAIRADNFFKSMTTHVDTRVWQDVYHARLNPGVTAYVKFTLRENGSVVIQFKEK